MQQAGVTVLEVTAPDKQDRRKRGKNDDLDARDTPLTPPSRANAPLLRAAVTA